MADMSLEGGLAVLERRTRLVRGLIFAYIAISVVTIFVATGEISGAVDLESSNPDLLSDLGGVAYFLFALVLLTSMVVISMWIYRAHANLRAGGVEGLEFSPGWSVGWFFIPIANLFKPFQAMRELWNASHSQDDSYTKEPDPKLALWWGFWIAGNIISNIGLRLEFTGGPDGQTVGLVLDIVSSALLIVAAWILLQIIVAVNSAQRSMVGLAAAFA